MKLPEIGPRNVTFYTYFYTIGVNTTAFGRKLTLFSAIPLSRFCPAYFAYFELGKMRSAQRQVDLRRLCNQLAVLCKANSLCKSVCALPVFT